MNEMFNNENKLVRADEKNKFNFAQKKENTIHSLKEVEMFLKQSQKAIKYLKFYKFFK